MSGCFVDVSHGERVLVWADLAESRGQALPVAEVLLSLTPAGTDMHSWIIPDETEQVSTSTCRVAVLVDDRFDPGTYRLVAKVSDFPETVFVIVQGGRVKVA
jgi:hypothetical protein